MKVLRRLLLPFSILYSLVTAVRNRLYDSGRWKSEKYELPVICVGNLSMGGTGKSPMIEYLLEFLLTRYKVSTLSRGYKRKTKGYKEVLTSSTAEEVGDEPLQFKKKYPKATVAVCADRREGIANLKKDADIILLDDAFQHRKVRPSFSIVLTPFDDLFIDDFVVPAGNLRESRSGMKRADIIVVTKCPSNVPYAKMQEIEFRMPLKPHQKLYFSSIGYSQHIYNVSESQSLDYLADKPFTLVTGIANPTPLLRFLKDRGCTFTHRKFADHHHFSEKEITSLQEEELILTTEKDYMRLQPKLNKFALYYLPITTQILKDQDSFFKETILKHVERYA